MTQQGSIENDETPAGGLRFVVALKPEADPVIEHSQLKPAATGGPFRCWRNEPADCWLVISGIGKTAAAAGAAWLHAISGASPAAAWINLGIAGHSSLEPGEIRRVHKITGAGSGRSWYPPMVVGGECGIASARLITVDRPAKEFPDGESLIDMEASGFFEAASRFTSLEMIHCLKVVSDNAETGFEDLKGNHGRIRELVALLVSELDRSGFLDALMTASSSESRRLADPPGFAAFFDRVRFTETQKHQLRRLLVRCRALGIDAKMPSEISDAKSVLREIESKLATHPAE